MNASAEDTARPMTTVEVARELGVERSTVARWIEGGLTVRGVPIRLEGFKAGQGYRISREALKAFLAACNPGRPVELESERKRVRDANAAAAREVEALAARKRKGKG